MKAIWCAVALVSMATSASAQDAARMDQIVQSYVDSKTFMGAVLVARGGDVILNKGYGSANLEWDIPNSPTTKFRLGSVTKQFTAAAILLLEERGKLKIDDRLKTYLHDSPPAWDAITIYHLLTHTSGIPNVTSLPEYGSMRPFDTPVTKTIATVRDRPLDFAPGEKMSYSNSGYIILGHVIETITGGRYETFVREHLFAPLGMKDSGYDSPTAIIGRRAAGYTSTPTGLENAGFIHMSIPHGAGALYSTTEDLLRWEQALFGGKVLSPASLEKMTRPFKNNYAFGLVVRTENGRRVFAHGGGIEGFNTALSYYPDTRITVAVLGNVNGRAPDEIGNKLGALAHGDAVQITAARKEIALPSSTLAKYVGTYELASGIIITIRLTEDHLTGQVSGQARYPLFAESENRFFFKVVDAQIDFVSDTNGAVTHLVLRQNGVDQKASRTSTTVAERKEITLAAAALTPLVGTYQMQPAVELSITLDGTQLMAQLTGQPRFPIFAESETRFFLKVVDATLEFTKDASGAVTAVTLLQGPVTLRGSRK